MENATLDILVTAGGLIRCQQCTARSKRSGQQCRKPALKSSRTKKCQLHGGRSGGPTTKPGKAASAAANLKHGRYSQATVQKDDRSRALMRVLEDATHLLGLVPQGTTRTTGRKPKMYTTIQSEADIFEAIISLKDD